jgi:membrane glycosyltransferase
MSEELDNPRVLRRLAWSLLAAMLAAAVGTTLAMAIHPLVVSLHVKFFMGRFPVDRVGSAGFRRRRIHMNVEEISALATSSRKSR